jgi:hypothetical protein
VSTQMSLDCSGKIYKYVSIFYSFTRLLFLHHMALTVEHLSIEFKDRIQR